MSWMRIKNIAKYMDSSPKTVRRMVKFGLPYHRLPNGTLLFSQDEVDEWIRISDPSKQISEIVNSVIDEATR